VGKVIRDGRACFASKDTPFFAVANIDIHFSPDDGGWYLQQYGTGKVSDPTSQIFGTAQEAMTALEQNNINWDI